MKKIVGDVVNVARNNPGIVLVHGCNCFHTMGAGVAKELRRIFPSIEAADKESVYGDIKKLGTYTSATMRNGTTIVNAYTQFRYGGWADVDYDAIKNVFNLIKQDFGDRPIYYPKIGSGYAGGDWRIIKYIIDKELNGCDHTLIVWEFDPEALSLQKSITSP